MEMKLIELNSLYETFIRLAMQLLESTEPTGHPRHESAKSAQQLVGAMRKLFDLLQAVQSHSDNEPMESDAEQDIHTLGDYGFHLLADLAKSAGSLGLDELSHQFEGLTLPLAVWISRQGGKIKTLEPIVNAIANEANSVREPHELERLYELTGEIEHAVIPAIQQDLEKSNPGRPWRILLLNRAIIATRSHQPELIEAAYGNLERLLPEEAARFFREGMQQMVALDYPQAVRDLVEKYYNLWSVERTLH